MPEKACGPLHSREINDLEKSTAENLPVFSAQPSTADHLSTKIEPNKPLSDDANVSEVAADKPEKEKKEDFKNYLVNSKSHIVMNSTDLSIANLPLCGLPQHALVCYCSHGICRC